MRMATLCSVLAGCLAATLMPASAQAQADFFKGKTVTVVVGARAVGSLSLSAQMLTRHWGRYIPGNPTVILRQMPGGAHLNATNHVFNVAEADGLTILAANPQVAMAQLFKMPAVRFDAREFIWLGSSGADAALLAIHPALPYKTFKDIQNAKEELIVGTTGPGSNAHDVPLLLKEFAGAKFKLVAGYAANTDIKLALERGRSTAGPRSPQRCGWRASRVWCARWCVRAARRYRDSITSPSTRTWRPATSAARSWSSAARRSGSGGRSGCGLARRRTASRCCASRSPRR